MTSVHGSSFLDLDQTIRLRGASHVQGNLFGMKKIQTVLVFNFQHKRIGLSCHERLRCNDIVLLGYTYLNGK